MNLFESVESKYMQIHRSCPFQDFFLLWLQLKQCVMVSNEIFQCRKMKHFDFSACGRVYVCLCRGWCTTTLLMHDVMLITGSAHVKCAERERIMSQALSKMITLFSFFMACGYLQCKKTPKQNTKTNQNRIISRLCCFPSAQLRILLLTLLRWILVLRFILGFIKIVWNSSKKTNLLHKLSCISDGVSF